MKNEIYKVCSGTLEAMRQQMSRLSGLDDGNIHLISEVLSNQFMVMLDIDPFTVLGKEIEEINAANGWNKTVPADWEDTYKVPAILALIHSEVSEALEAFRHDDVKHFSEELADVAIRLIGFCHSMGVDLRYEIHDKLEKNRQRGFRHGGKKV